MKPSKKPVVPPAKKVEPRGGPAEAAVPKETLKERSLDRWENEGGELPRPAAAAPKPEAIVPVPPPPAPAAPPPKAGSRWR